MFTIGKVTGVHGLNGNLKVWSFAESIDTFGAGRIVLLKTEDGQQKGKYTILNAQPHKKGVLLLLDGIDTRNLAESLIGCEILIDREQLPEPEEDTWYWQDLMGLKVTDDLRGYLGDITDIFPTGANDVLVVTQKGETVKAENQPDTEILIPMHEQFVREVDLDQGIMTVALPEDYA